jgi:hypothetical protein
MRFHIKPFILFATATVLLSLPASYLLKEGQPKGDDEPVQTLTKYLRFIYSRDFKQAYRFISLEDKRLKEESIYVRERGPFSGFALEAAKELSKFIEFTPAQIKIDGDRARVMLAFRAPDMNSVTKLLLDWDEKRLDALPSNEQKKLLASLDGLKRKGGLEMIEGQEEFRLVKEGNNWRLFLDWASAIRVHFAALVPPGGLIEAKPTIKETLAKPNELFTIAYRVKNLTDKDIVARIHHRIEPAALAEYLDLVECGLLLPVTLSPGEAHSYSSTYVIRDNIPDRAKRLDVTYDFKVEH